MGEELERQDTHLKVNLVSLPSCSDKMIEEREGSPDSIDWHQVLAGRHNRPVQDLLEPYRIYGLQCTIYTDFTNETSNQNKKQLFQLSMIVLCGVL